MTRLDEIKAKYDFDKPMADGFPISDVRYLIARVERLERALKMICNELPLRESMLISSAVKEALTEGEERE